MFDETTLQVQTVIGQCATGAWGHVDGQADVALLNGPMSIDMSSWQTLYVADAGNDAVRVIDLANGIAHASIRTLQWQPQTQLHFPTNLRVIAGDPTYLVVSSHQDNRIYALSSLLDDMQTIQLLAGDGGFGYQDGPATTAEFRGPRGLAFAQGSLLLGPGLFVADWYNQRIRWIGNHAGNSSRFGDFSKPRLDVDTNERDLLLHESWSRPRVPFTPATWMQPLAGRPIRTMVWTGHSGPYHDHAANGKILAQSLNRSQAFVTWLADNETVFSDGSLSDIDVLLLYADTYENPLHGSLSAEEWAGLFAFVANGGGLLALHTASACWMNPNDTLAVKFHSDVLNAQFGKLFVLLYFSFSLFPSCLFCLGDQNEIKCVFDGGSADLYVSFLS